MRESDYIKAIMEIDAQIADHEAKIKHLRYDREGTIQALVDLRASRTPVMEG